jgi:hypothetical protein
VVPAIAFASENVLVGMTSGDSSATPATVDHVFTIAVDSGTISAVYAAKSSFVLGDVFCHAAAGACWVADAENNALQPWTLTGATLTEGTPIVVNTTTGLPPRSFGTY